MRHSSFILVICKSSYMKRSFIEKLLSIIAWVGLVGGILFSILYCNSILGSGTEMCVPTGLAYLAGGHLHLCWLLGSSDGDSCPFRQDQEIGEREGGISTRFNM